MTGGVPPEAQPRYLGLAPVLAGILMMAFNIGPMGRTVLITQVLFTLCAWFFENMPTRPTCADTTWYSMGFGSIVWLAHTGLAPIAVATAMMFAAARVQYVSLEAMRADINHAIAKAITAVDLE